MEFNHKAFYGMTKMGKTATMKKFAVGLRKDNQKVIVYSGNGDLSWPQGCQITMSVDGLEALLRKKENRHAHVFLDEARVLYKKMKPSKHPYIDNLFTMGRHKGFTCYIATQYPTSIPPEARVNCGECYCFRLGSKAYAQIVCEDYGDLEYKGEKITKQILKLPELTFFHIVSPDTVKLKQLTF
jgi:hypothetical protein